MHKIRYYTQSYEPSQFGRLVRLFNWLRFWIEVWVQYLVMKELLKTYQIRKPDRKQYVEMFWRDVRQDVAVWKETPDIETQIIKQIAEAPKQDRPQADLSELVSKGTAPRRSQRYIKARELVPERDSEDFEHNEENNNERAAQIHSSSQDSGRKVRANPNTQGEGS